MNDEMWKNFKMPAKFAVDVRKETWKRYLQLPHESKYYIDNPDGTVSYNLQNIPLSNQQNYVNAVTSENRKVTNDFIGSAGGNVSSWMEKTHNYDLINLEDWWDLNPVQDPNSAGILPDKLLNFITHSSNDGEKRTYKKWVPNWFKNIEVGKFVGGKPFLNKTIIKAKQISKDLGSYEYKLSDDELKNEYMSNMLDMYDFGDYEDYDDTVKWLENKFYNEYLPKAGDQKRIRTKNYSDEYLLNMYGPFKRQYREGGQVEPNNKLRYDLGLSSVSTADFPIMYDEKQELKNKIRQYKNIVNPFKLKENELLRKLEETAELYDIPKIKDKEITLSNAGSMTGAVLSTNLLDSIYKYANITDLPLVEAIGLPAQESAFGKWRRINGNAYYNSPENRDTRPDKITSDWEYTDPGILQYINSSRLEAGYKNSKEEDDMLLWDNAKDMDKRDPLAVLERSRPKVAGIPINDRPLSGTDPLGELYLNLVSGNAVRKAVVNGVNGIVRKSFYDNYKELLKAGWNRQRAYNYASPELGISVLPGITKGFDYTIRGANYTHAVEDFVK